MDLFGSLLSKNSWAMDALGIQVESPQCQVMRVLMLLCFAGTVHEVHGFTK